MKRDLADLLRTALQPPDTPQTPADTTDANPAAGDPPSPAPAPRPDSTPVRHTTTKDAVLWADQVRALDTLLERLRHERTNRANKLTRNTILRAMIDGLLPHADDIHGNTEDEIRDSIRRRITRQD